MKIKTSELSGAALDWAVAQCENEGKSEYDQHYIVDVLSFYFSPSSNWSKGGPIIEREKIFTEYDEHWKFDPSDPEDNGERWFAKRGRCSHYGSTTASRLGEEVDVPDELVN